MYQSFAKNKYADVAGIQFWAVSFCRSTLAFYEALANELGVPFRICLSRGGLGARGEIGFTETEFEHLELLETPDRASAISALHERAEWLQIFGSYQTTAHIQAAIRVAIKHNYRFGIASESPCNMLPPGIKRLQKRAYVKAVLPIKLRDIINSASFILNWSGDEARPLISLGWSQEKIIPTGYYPPALPGTNFVERTNEHFENFQILSTSGLTWHRGPDVLIAALALLKKRGVSVRASITGSGDLEKAMRAQVEANALSVEFLGRVPMDDLIQLYQNCSLFVASGREEPWGIRVNDALNAGAPTIVSRGMGATKLVSDFNIGVTCADDDPVDLSWKIQRLVKDRAHYMTLSKNLASVKERLLPQSAASVAAKRISYLI